MFKTLIFQQLNKLVETEVRYFPALESFHPVNVEYFESECVKPSAQISGKFPLPVSALIGNLPVLSCERTAHALIQRPEFTQGLFEELWVLYFLTIAQCQKSLQSEVCPHTLTCGGQRFSRRIVCDNSEPVDTNTISTDLDVFNIPLPRSVLMERIPDFVECERLGFFIPRFERYTDTSIFQFIACLKLSRTHFMSFLRLRNSNFSATILLVKKELLPSKFKTNNNIVKSVSRYPSPVTLSPFQKFGKMGLEFVSASGLPEHTEISFLKSKEVVMDISKLVQHIAKTFVLRMVANLVFVRSHNRLDVNKIRRKVE